MVGADRGKGRNKANGTIYTGATFCGTPVTQQVFHPIMP
jgi:hypothetical protein